MKFSIRTKFSVGMVFLLIILALSIFSAYYMNKLSKETGTILKENYLSVVYAREMAWDLTKINQEITNLSLTNKLSDSLFIKKELNDFNQSLKSEKENLTEPGEDKLVSGIETGVKEYREVVLKYLKSPQDVANSLDVQKRFSALYQQLMLLSRMNGKAIEVKTADNKISTQDALTQMTILATLCFIIALFYSYSFSTYSNERFLQLYKGILEIGSGDYDQRLNFEGTDEFYQISLVINQMAAKLEDNEKKLSLTLSPDLRKDITFNDIEALKGLLLRIKNIEGEAETLITRLEGK